MNRNEESCRSRSLGLRSLISQREPLEVGLGTSALTLSQIRTGQREARGPGDAEKSREQRFSRRLSQVKGKGGRK